MDVHSLCNSELRRTRSPSREKLPDNYGPCLRLNSRSNASCDRPLFKCEKREAPSSSRRSEDTSVAGTSVPKATVVKSNTTLSIGIPRSVDTLITERRFRESASRATGSLCKSFNEQCSVALEAVALSRHRGSTEIGPVIPRCHEDLNEPTWQWTPNETTCAGTAPTGGQLLVSEPLPCQNDENAAKVHQRFPAGIHRRLVPRKMHTGRFENDLSESSFTECAVPPELMRELVHSSLYPKHLPATDHVGSRKARTTPDINVYHQGSRIISKPGVQLQATTVEKFGPSGHPAGWHETQVLTVLVSNLTARGALSAEEMDRDSVRLFSKPTTSAGISPTGTRAGPSSTGKMPTEIASAKAGAASSTFPTAMTSRGPGVMSQAPVIGRANGVVRTGVGATSVATPGYATSLVSAGVCVLSVYS
nr:uncharacterized protein LOC119184960 [Rhipicephalus microplus]